jgi:hypothetical protein
LQLINLIRRQSSQPASPGVRALADELLKCYGTTAQAILFYGSCLRTADDFDGLVDLYLLVDSYRSTYRSQIQAALNKVLPPNVFYLELPFEGRVVRTKYAVLSLEDFRRGTSRRWFHSYLWGRFAQPAGLLFARDDRIAGQVQAAMAQAVITFVTRVLPQASQRFTARELWHQGLALSYRAELRAERPDNLIQLFDAAREHYEEITRFAMEAVPLPVEIFATTEPIHYQANVPARARYRSRLGWKVRSLQGKLLSVLRLLKGLTTFQGGPDYILWKIERHSGVRVELPPRLRRHPLLAAIVLSLRLYRKGGFR